MGRLSTKLHVDPVLELPLSPLGINSRFRFHIFKKDLNFLIQVFLLRVYDKHCTLEAGDVVVDCGAYIGDFTVRAASLVGPEGLVLAFEPNPQSYAICSSNIRLNGLRNVKLFNVALGEQISSGYLKISLDNLGRTRVVNDFDLHSTKPIEVRPLTEFLQPLGSRGIKLMKVHAEGYASKILEGASDVLEKGVIKNFSFELHRGEEQVPRILESFGYRCSIEEKVYLYATRHESSLEPS